jgi:hypothetical protein
MFVVEVARPMRMVMASATTEMIASVRLMHVVYAMVLERFMNAVALNQIQQPVIVQVTC